MSAGRETKTRNHTENGQLRQAFLVSSAQKKGADKVSALKTTKGRMEELNSVSFTESISIV